MLYLCAVGDVALGGALSECGEKAAGAEELKSLFARGDINFLNLDCTFDRSGAPPHPEEYLVCAPPGRLDLLREWGVHIVSQANNHSLDFGGEALAKTQAHLGRRGIECVGAGPNLAAARQARILERGGVRVGFLAYASTHPWVGALRAGESRAGAAPLEPGIVREDIAALKGKVDWVVVSAHWGKEYMHYPPPGTIALARRIIDWGGHLVLGHHPHAIQGIEEYRGGIICYSLGNFLFPDYPGQDLVFGGAARAALLLRFGLGPEKLEIEEILPVEAGAGAWPLPLEGARKERVLGELREYSAALGRADYAGFWRAQVRRREIRRLWEAFNREVLRVGWRRGGRRLLRLGGKNFRSIGRSLAEILVGSGRS